VNILLADDEAGIREGLASFLRLKGLTVRTASSCAEALDLLDQEDFDAVLTDWHLEDGVAWSVVDRSEVPVLVVSGYPEEVQYGPNLVRVLSKPVAPRDMLAELHAVVSAARPDSNPAEHASAEGCGAAVDPAPEQAVASCWQSLPEDARARCAVVLGWLDLSESAAGVAVSSDGVHVELTAQCPRGFDPLAVPGTSGTFADDLTRWLGGDLRVLQRDGCAVIEYRVLAHGGLDQQRAAVDPSGPWPEGDVLLDLHATPVAPQAFLQLLDRIERRGAGRGAVQICNTPSGWRLLAEASGRGHLLPKREPAGPRLPEALALLWS